MVIMLLVIIVLFSFTVGFIVGRESAKPIVKDSGSVNEIDGGGDGFGELRSFKE